MSEILSVNYNNFLYKSYGNPIIYPSGLSFL